MGPLHHSIYEDIIEVTEDYLGPSSGRFVNRQIKTHLNKKPEKLQPKDVDQLADWLRISLAFITDDEKILDNYERDLKEIQAYYKRKD